MALGLCGQELGQQGPQLVRRARIWVKRNALDLGPSHGTESSADRVAAGTVFRKNVTKRCSEPYSNLKTVLCWAAVLQTSPGLRRIGYYFQVY